LCSSLNPVGAPCGDVGSAVEETVMKEVNYADLLSTLHSSIYKKDSIY
jgi:predicted PP-loop superfamily ATPase